MNKRILAMLLCVVMCIGLFAACGSSTATTTTTAAPAAEQKTETAATEAPAAEAAPAEPKHLNVGWHAALKTIDPLKSSWEAPRLGIGETLTRVSDDLTLIPWLAESWENVDELTWKFTIREGVTYSNGKVVDAAAVKEALQRPVDNYARAATMLNIESMEADGQILTIKTAAVNAALPSNLADHCAQILDPESMEDENGIPVGTGPFAITSWDHESKMELEANTSYWGGEPKIATVTVTVISDGNAQAMALDNGEVDLCFQLPTENVRQFIGNDKFVINKNAGSRSQMMYFNLNNSILSDLSVRKAISMLIDRDALANVVNKGDSQPATAMFPTGVAFGQVDGIACDKEGAIALLTEAGWADTDGDGILDKNGQPLSLRFITYGAHGALLPTFAEAIQATLKEAGIAIDITLNEYSAYIDVLKSDDFDLALGSNIMAPAMDPQYFADICFRTGASYNYGHYSNAEVDALVDKLDSEFDTAQRVELAKEMQKYIVEDCGWLMLGHLKFQVVGNAKVTGYETQGTELYLLTANTDIAQ